MVHLVSFALQQPFHNVYNAMKMGLFVQSVELGIIPKALIIKHVQLHVLRVTHLNFLYHL